VKAKAYDLIISLVVPSEEVPDTGFEDTGAIVDEDGITTFVFAFTSCVSEETGLWLREKFLKVAQLGDLHVDVCS
jgi:hypothetical protein